MAVRANSTLASRRRPAFDAARGINIARPPPVQGGFPSRRAKSPFAHSSERSAVRTLFRGKTSCCRHASMSAPCKEIGRAILRRLVSRRTRPCVALGRSDIRLVQGEAGKSSSARRRLPGRSTMPLWSSWRSTERWRARPGRWTMSRKRRGRRACSSCDQGLLGGTLVTLAAE